jgi:hypothetical protein
MKWLRVTCLLSHWLLLKVLKVELLKILKVVGA